MSDRCASCGIGQRLSGRACDWCGAPQRVRVPLWTAVRHRLPRSPAATALRDRVPVVTGVTVGVAVHLVVAALGVATGLHPLWQTGLLWSAQWWWALAPEAVQPWAFAILRGAAYGLLAGWLTGLWGAGSRQRVVGVAGGRGRQCTSEADGTAPTSAAVSPIGLTALAAYVIAGWEQGALTQDRLVAAAVGAVVGRLTILMVGRRSVKV